MVLTALTITGDVRRVRSGDVIEFLHRGHRVTALVLLASEDGSELIIDLLDGSVPESVLLAQLGTVYVFDGERYLLTYAA